MVPDLVVETTELCGLLLGSILSQRLSPAVVDLLFSGNKNVLSSDHKFCVLGVLGSISFLLGASPSCGRGWPIRAIFTSGPSTSIVEHSS